MKQSTAARIYAPRRLDQAGRVHRLVMFVVVFILLLGMVNMYRSVSGHADAATPEIASAVEGYCVDDYHDNSAANSQVDAWKCNGTAAQDWSIIGNKIKHDPTGCLEVSSNNTVVLNPCTNSARETWQVDLGGYQNPLTGLCLTMPGAQPERQLRVSSCNNLASQNEGWAADRWSDDNMANASCNYGTEGQRVACVAESQWSIWQSGHPSHTALLTSYTDGNSYEEWCADFVSYVYDKAGYPFTAGERDGWDEYNAENIQNMGFTLHPAGSYIPKPGDVAFFDYPGGHVEIVAVGGKNPTFIYGDSGTTDPSTGNGEMNEDMLTNDGNAGQVTYYLSPN